MATRNLRILIADDQCSQRIRLEKILNRLGYYCVAPVQSFSELLTLTHYACEPSELLDVLLINMALARAAGIDIAHFCYRKPHVRNALVYGVADREMEVLLPIIETSPSTHWVEGADEQTVRLFMERIDPGSDSALASLVPSTLSSFSAKKPW